MAKAWLSSTEDESSGCPSEPRLDVCESFESTRRCAGPPGTPIRMTEPVLEAVSTESGSEMLVLLDESSPLSAGASRDMRLTSDATKRAMSVV
jgi:hypothetical protein